MYKFMNIEKAKLLALITTLCFLVIHIFMFLLFRYFGVTPMMYFNIFSVLFYTSLLWLVKTEKFRFYVTAVYIEVVLHMTLAVIFTGWESGFQITLIGISILLFYGEYVSRYLKKPYIPSIPTCLLGPVAYIGSYIWVHYHSPEYLLTRDANFIFQIFWGIVVFSITIVILYIFVELCVQSEEYLENEVGHDQLTGLPNRYFISDSIGNLDFLEKEDEGHVNHYWAAMVDIDDFKMVNDTYGHNYGDYVLKEIAKILLLWKEDCGVKAEFGSFSEKETENSPNKIGLTVGRWGGEEFLILGQGGQKIGEMLDGLRKRVMNHEFLRETDGRFEDKYIHVTVTIGYAMYKPGMTAREWIGIADNMLYKGKASGKNKVVA